MKASSGREEDSSDDSDDFDEVPEKEGYEPHIPEHLRAEYGEFSTHTLTHAPQNLKTSSINSEVKLQRRPSAALILEDSRTHSTNKHTRVCVSLCESFLFCLPMVLEK